MCTLIDLMLQRYQVPTIEVRARLLHACARRTNVMSINCHLWVWVLNIYICIEYHLCYYFISIIEAVFNLKLNNHEIVTSPY